MGPRVCDCIPWLTASPPSGPVALTPLREGVWCSPARPYGCGGREHPDDATGEQGCNTCCRPSSLAGNVKWLFLRASSRLLPFPFSELALMQCSLPVCAGPAGAHLLDGAEARPQAQPRPGGLVRPEPGDGRALRAVAVAALAAVDAAGGVRGLATPSHRG